MTKTYLLNLTFLSLFCACSAVEENGEKSSANFAGDTLNAVSYEVIYSPGVELDSASILPIDSIAKAYFNAVFEGRCNEAYMHLSEKVKEEVSSRISHWRNHQES